MNPYYQMPLNCYTRHNALRSFFPASEDKWVSPVYVETNMGPWGWQWGYGIRDLILTPPSEKPITIGVLMNDIEEVGAFRGVLLTFVVTYEGNSGRTRNA